MTHDKPGGTALAPRLDPELERTALLYRRIDHSDPLAVRREGARRIRLARMTGQWAATDGAVHVQDTVISGGTGQDVTVRVYRPVRRKPPHPAVLYLHGGAFISGDLDFEHPRCLEMCREAGVVVASVDYRLAPEFPFPAGLDDCVAAYRWLCAAEGAVSDVDTTRIAVAGASAGGALATALCLRARDAGLPLPGLQMLLYPVLDHRMETTSMRAFTATPVWDSRNCLHMWRQYLGPMGQTERVSPYASPALAEDLSGLPGAYIMTADHDPLRDEGARYAQRLADVGVPGELHQFPGTFHGFDTLADAAVSRRSRREYNDILRAALS